MEQPGAHRMLLGVEHIDKVIEIDQAPIGRTPRSNPATYTGVFAPIRELFAMLPESRERGYKPGRFSFNVKGGRCEACQGEGLRRIEMNFLPDVYVTCEVCRGRRYNAETLAVRYKGHSITDVLNLPSSDAVKLLENIPQIQQKLRRLWKWDWGTCSWGNRRRRFRAARRSESNWRGSFRNDKRAGRCTSWTSRPRDCILMTCRNCWTCCIGWWNLGNTVLIIEHNLDVIKQADWIIDLGPEGGAGGGRIVAQGTPEQVAKTKKSYTGQALAKHLGMNGAGIAPSNGNHRAS